MIRCDGNRLWGSLMQMAEIGATAAGGCNRQALTNEDRKGRDLFVQWCREAGCDVRVDQLGNLFAERRGQQPELATVLVGSHLDTQPTGGRFDGVYGVLAGLELVRTLNDHGIRTDRSITIASWTNEEGVRFAPAMMGSGAWAGVFKLDTTLETKDAQGCSVGEALKTIGYNGSSPCEPFAVHAAFEAHIEQGPILERDGDTIGVVTGVQGINWYDVVIQGEPCHAGPTPMSMRKDPIIGLSSILSRTYESIGRHTDQARCTFGDIRVLPASRNTVPQEVRLSVDIRHPNQSSLDTMEGELRQNVADIAAQYNLDARVETIWRSPAIEFDAGCVSAVTQAAQRMGVRYQKMVSGAGHDSVYVSRCAPTSMIFVPCAGGLSHNERESADAEDLAAGCDVLLHAVLDKVAA